MKKLIFFAFVAAIVGMVMYEPARNRVIEALPEKVTSAFESDPLPKDLVLGLSDNQDLGFALPATDGQEIGAHELKGKIAMVLVWNTQCGAKCLETMEHMQKLARKYAKQDVVAVTINNDMLTKGASDDQIRKYMADHGIQLPVLLMDLSTGRTFWPNDCKYGLAPQPFHELLVYDRNGAVRFRANQDYLRPVVQELLTGNWSDFSDERVKAGTNPPAPATQ